MRKQESADSLTSKINQLLGLKANSHRLSEISFLAAKPKTPLKNLLKAIKALYKKLGIEIAEWYEKDQMLYIIEPAFIFYLRWHVPRRTSPTVGELIEYFFPGFDIKQTSRGLRIGFRKGSI